jgi:hypothetical protein
MDAHTELNLEWGGTEQIIIYRSLNGPYNNLFNKFKITTLAARGSGGWEPQ